MPIHPEAQALLSQLLSAHPPVQLPSFLDRVRQTSGKARSLAGQSEPVERIEDRIITTSVGEIPLRFYSPKPEQVLPIVVYFHGGGFISGDLDSHDTTCRILANRVPCLVVSVDYRLAPEHRFPAAIEDAYAATKWIAIHATQLGGDASRIAVVGDSAGGNLAAVVALMARDQGEPRLMYQVLLYPALDATMSCQSIITNATVPPLPSSDIAMTYSYYLPSTVDRKQPYVSPMWATDLHHLPPALIVTAEYDPLRDEGEAYAEQLQQAGIPVVMTRYDGMIHGFFQMAGVLQQGKQVVEQTASALQVVFAASDTEYNR